jgi:hypothetical protein
MSPSQRGTALPKAGRGSGRPKRFVVLDPPRRACAALSPFVRGTLITIITDH